jgi:plasmid maintenance system antidote protein VapI
VRTIHRTPQNRALRVALEQKDLGRDELARLAGLHPGTIQRVVAGRQTLSDATAARVAEILGSTPEALGLVRPEGRAER